MATTRSIRFSQTRVNFLPVQPRALVERILADPSLSGERREAFGQFAEMLRARFHFESLATAEHLQTLFDPFDPDRDTLPLKELSEEDRVQGKKEFEASLCDLLGQGNYRELSHEEIAECINAQSSLGVRVFVDLSRFDTLRVFYRGLQITQKRVRSWRTVFLPGVVDVQAFSRLAVLIGFRRDQEDRLVLKLFKNVLVEDLETVAPDIRIRMPLLDQLRVGGTLLGGMVMPGIKLLTAIAISPWLVATVAAGFFGACLKTFFSFLGTRTKYMQKLSSCLYFQCLANNTSALARLVKAAEDEEFKEALLAYFLLCSHADRSWTRTTLDAAVEEWLVAAFGLTSVDFEIDDALRKLLDKGLVRECAPDEGEEPRLVPVELQAAQRNLDEWWDNRYRFYHPEDGTAVPRPAYLSLKRRKA